MLESKPPRLRDLYESLPIRGVIASLLIGLPIGCLWISVVALATSMNAQGSSRLAPAFLMLLLGPVVGGLPGVFFGWLLGKLIQEGHERFNLLESTNVDALPAHAGTLGAVLSPLNLGAWLGVTSIGHMDGGTSFAVSMASMVLPIAGFATGYSVGLWTRRKLFFDRLPTFPFHCGLSHLMILVGTFAVCHWLASQIVETMK